MKEKGGIVYLIGVKLFSVGLLYRRGGSECPLAKTSSQSSAITTSMFAGIPFYVYVHP